MKQWLWGTWQPRIPEPRILARAAIPTEDAFRPEGGKLLGSAKGSRGLFSLSEPPGLRSSVQGRKAPAPPGGSNPGWAKRPRGLKQLCV